MAGVLQQDWNYLSSAIYGLWNPEAVGGAPTPAAGSSVSDWLYNAATGTLSDSQVQQLQNQVYKQVIGAGGTAKQAQDAANQVRKTANPPPPGMSTSDVVLIGLAVVAGLALASAML